MVNAGPETICRGIRLKENWRDPKAPPGLGSGSGRPPALTAAQVVQHPEVAGLAAMLDAVGFRIDIVLVHRNDRTRPRHGRFPASRGRFHHEDRCRARHDPASAGSGSARSPSRYRSTEHPTHRRSRTSSPRSHGRTSNRHTTASSAIHSTSNRQPAPERC